MKAHGFTLLETLIALAVGSVLMLGATRLLPLLQGQNLRLMMQVQLNEELLQIMQTLEKVIRRAGYCHGDCHGPAFSLQSAGSCLLLRWDENSNGKWEAAGRDDSELYGFRLRADSLEMQRGVSSCQGGGWERLNDPRMIGIRAFRVTRAQRQVKITLGGYAKLLPTVTQRVEHWLTAENL